MKQLTFISLLFSLLSFQAKAALFGYCLDDGESLNAAKASLSTILAPGDKVFLRASVNCLEVKGNPVMFELYGKYLRMNFRVLRAYRGQDSGVSTKANISTGLCRIKVTKLGKRSEEKNRVDIGTRNQVSKSEASGQSKSVSNLVLSYGKRANLRVGNQSLGVTCAKAGAGYQMQFDLEFGDQLLSSNAFVGPGQKLNIGSIANDLDNKRRTLSSDKGLQYEKTKGLDNHDYFLEVQ